MTRLKGNRACVILGLVWLINADEGMAERVTSLDLYEAPWNSVNDGVMGGVSTGRIETAEGLLIFRGELSLDNGGGFASIRRPVLSDLTSADRVRLQLRGDGREYQFRIRLDRRFDGVAWRAKLPTDGRWQTLTLRLDDFAPVYRGRPVPDAGPVIPGRIRQIGFMLADKTAGPFQLEVRSITFLSAADDALP